MNPAEDIERAIREMQFRTRAAADERVMKDALAALDRKDNNQTTRTSVWRTIMTNKWTRIVPAAAAIIVIAVVSVTMLNKSATKAYAIEQTVEANRGVSFVHFRIEPARKGNTNEGWAQFGDNGELLHLRWVIPDSEDGPKDVVWQAGKAEVWLKAKNVAVTVREPDAVARMGKEFRAFTPTVVVDELLQDLAQGKVQAETKQSGDGKAEIRLIVQESPDRRDVYHIDPDTKLLQKIEKFKGKGENEKLGLQVTYLDYNQAPADDLFTLNPPADVMRVDQTTQEIGLLKGDMTDEQIAMKVAREFFEAVIAGDYAKAGRLYEGIPAEKVKEVLSGEGKVLRVVSVGTPTPHSATRSLQVLCQIEVEINGQRVTKTYHPFIRPVYGQPDRWGIIGGI
jgi:hypothetical protein